MQDWSAKRALKEQLLQALARIPHGSPQGVDLPQNDPLYAVAVQELLKDNPQFRVIRSGTTFTILKDSGVTAGASGALREQLTRDGHILGPGAILFHDD